ncbi:hypothetical protein V5O48_014700, partial [Marasmius crinis-equi]
LFKARAETRYLHSETMLTRMINNTVQTGAITVICAAVDLALFTKYVDTNYHYVPYSNSLMLNLNLRKPQRHSSSTSFTVGASDTLPMHYFRSVDSTVKKKAGSSHGVRAANLLEPERSVIGSVNSSQQENDVAKLVGICFENCEFLGLTEILKDNRSSLDVEPNRPTPVNIRIHTVTTTQQDIHRPDPGTDN